MSKKYTQRFPLTFILLFAALGSLEAWPGGAKKEAPPLNPGTIRDFFDNHVPELTEKAHIVGTVVSVVQKGRTVMKKGYGYSNLQERIQVDPDKTLFRPGSISKLFVWTAIMQLLDQGKVDLNVDISMYLNFNMTESSKEAITLSHLMSHTAGFEDFLINLFVKDPEKVMTLEEAVTSRSLQRMRPPGQEISYSNYGTMVAGLIVERVSGMPFEEYIETRIFEPLGMRQSTFRQSLPLELQRHMSVGYSYDGNSALPREFEFIQGTPAGGLSSSATDMALFMKAHLSRNGGGLLKPATMKQMHSILFRPDPSLNGIAYGFLDLSTNGQHVIGHAGDTIYFHSFCFLIPEHSLGVYFSFNTGMEGGPPEFLTLELYRQFMNYFFPAPTGAELAKDFNSSTTDTGLYPGIYLTNKRAESELTKIIGLFMCVKVVRGKEKGSLKIASFLTREMEDYIEIAPRLFQKVDGQDRVAFLLDGEGHVNGLFSSSFPIMHFNRPPWWETPAFNFFILGLGLLLLVLGMIVRPTGLLAILSRKQQQPQEDVAPRLAGWLGSVVIVLYLFFLVGAFFVTPSDVIFAGVPPVWPFLIPWVAFSVGLSLPIFAVLALKEGYWGPFGRIFYAVFAMGMQVFFWFLWYWGIAA